MPDNKISEITRLRLFEAFEAQELNWSGRMRDADFLSRSFDLQALPSSDARFKTMAGDVQMHTTNFEDWDKNWIYQDKRLNLLWVDDKKFLHFLSQLVHPLVRKPEESPSLVKQINEFLWIDGFELAATRQISGVPVYEGREIPDEHEDELSQQAAPYAFVWDSRLLEARPQHSRVEHPTVADDLIAAIIEKGIDLQSALISNAADDRLHLAVSRLLECVKPPDGLVREGVLLMRFRTLEAFAAQYANPNFEAHGDVQALMLDLIRSTEDLVSEYPSLRQVEANRHALQFQAQPETLLEFRAHIAALVEAARGSSLVHPTAVSALEEGMSEFDALSEAAHTASNREARDALLSKRSVLAGLQTLDHKNFAAVVVDRAEKVLTPSLQVALHAASVPDSSVRRSIEEKSEYSLNFGIIRLAISIVHPVEGLASFALNLKSLVRRLRVVEGKTIPE